jgi:hypothetical protein
MGSPIADVASLTDPERERFIADLVGEIDAWWAKLEDLARLRPTTAGELAKAQIARAVRFRVGVAPPTRGTRGTGE